MPDQAQAPSWWQTLPGIATAIAALLTAVAGLLGVLYQTGVLGEDGPVTTQGPIESSRPGTVSVSAPVKPWNSTVAVITGLDGTVTEIRADTLRLCFSDQGLQLQSGQNVPFNKMRSFEILSVDPESTSMLIFLLDGKSISQNAVGQCSYISGENDIGRVDTSIGKIKRIDFLR